MTFYGITQGAIDLLISTQGFNPIVLGSALASDFMVAYGSYEYDSWADWTYNACASYDGATYADSYGATYAITYYFETYNNIRAVEWI